MSRQFEMVWALAGGASRTGSNHPEVCSNVVHLSPHVNVSEFSFEYAQQLGFVWASDGSLDTLPDFPIILVNPQGGNRRTGGFGVLCAYDG